MLLLRDHVIGSISGDGRGKEKKRKGKVSKPGALDWEDDTNNCSIPPYIHPRGKNGGDNPLSRTSHTSNQHTPSKFPFLQDPANIWDWERSKSEFQIIRKISYQIMDGFFQSRSKSNAVRKGESEEREPPKLSLSYVYTSTAGKELIC